MPTFLFHRGRSRDVGLEIKELEIITPFFLKGQLDSVWELLFRVSDYYISGETLYRKYRKVLQEADSILISGNYFNYKSYKKRVLLNYCLGFMKLEIKKQENNREDKK